MKHVETGTSDEGRAAFTVPRMEILVTLVKGFGGVMIRQIPLPDLLIIAHHSGRVVKTLFQ